MTFAEQIGRNLRKARRRAYMSQCELSRSAGLHHATISLLELGLRVPRIDTCAKILEVTEADPRILFEGIAWHGPVRLGEEGWFTIVGVEGAVDLRPPRRGRGT